MKKSRYNYFIKTSENDKILVYNSLRGAVMEINEQELSLLESPESASSSEIELLHLMKQDGFVCDNNVDELQVAKEIVKQRIEKLTVRHNDRLFLTIVPTFNCNFECRYCYESKKSRGQKLHMANKVQKLIVDYIEHRFMENIKFLKIYYFGGEPLLGLEVINELQQQILGLSRKYNVLLNTNIITNGSLLTPNVSRLLYNLQINSLQITLDGVGQKHNEARYFPDIPDENFDLIIENIKASKELFEIFVRINVGPNNIMDAYHLVDYFINEGIWPHKNIKFSLERLRDGYDRSIVGFKKHEFGVKHNEFRQFLTLKYNEISKTKKAKYKFIYPSDSTHAGCSLNYSGHNTIAIGPDGNIYQCWHHMEPKDKIGTIEELVGNNISQEILHKYCISLKKREEIGCFKCKLFPVCEPTCFYYFINFNDHDRNCSYWIGLIEMLKSQYNFYLENEEIIETNFSQ